jgi:RNA polymerase primary sigma factor
MTYNTRAGHDLLSAADEVRLAKLLEQGRAAAVRLDAGEADPGDVELIAAAKRARHRFIEANLRLAMSMAHKLPAPPHVDRQDMIQDAMLGLDRAVDGFDWRRGFRFSTYASWWIRQSVQQGLERTAAPVKIPTQRVIQLQNTLRDAGGDARQLPSKLATALRLSTMASLDAGVADGGGSLADMVAAPGADPLEQLLAERDRASVAALLGSLDPMNRHAVARRFGLDGHEPASFKEIAHEMQISPEAARRRVLRSLKSLRPAATRLAA